MIWPRPVCAHTGRGFSFFMFPRAFRGHWRGIPRHRRVERENRAFHLHSRGGKSSWNDEKEASTRRALAVSFPETQKMRMCDAPETIAGRAKSHKKCAARRDRLLYSGGSQGGRYFDVRQAKPACFRGITSSAHVYSISTYPSSALTTSISPSFTVS